MSIRQEFAAKYRPLFETQARYILLWGGRARGGSHTATQYFLTKLTRPEYFRGYFMREVFSDIRESLWRDFQDRIEENDTVNPRAIVLNDTTMKASCPGTGNFIMSKGFKKGSKARTAKLKSLAGATHVIIEEADEISEEDFMQLDDTLRTTKAQIQIILIFNPPPKRHWIWKRWFLLLQATIAGYFRAIPKTKPELLSIFGTYLDNQVNCNPGSVERWKEYKTSNPEHYWTMILGLVSEGARGRIFKDKPWIPIVAMPNQHQKYYGLDWGFSTDPLALVEHESQGRRLYADLKIYKTNLFNDQLEEELIRLGISKRAPIYCDPSNPKDREDMKRRGWNFIEATGGPGSVNSGINNLKQFDIFVTESSKELWEENANYAWALDQHKEPTSDPEDKHNHAIDAMRYGQDHVRKPRGLGVVKPGARTTSGQRSEYNM